MYDLGLRIKEIRTQRGMAQNELAKRINKSKAAVCGYEKEAQVPPLDVLVSIASVLNVSLDYLAGFEDNNSIPLRNLTSQQQRILHLIMDEFTNATNTSHTLSQQQITIIQELMCLFSGYTD